MSTRPSAILPGLPLQAGSLRYSAWGLAAVVFWLLVGELGIAMRERWALPTGLVMLRSYGASDTTVSLLLSTLPALISVFIVPYIGFRSDRYRSRWGRRRPFLLASAVFGALAMLGAIYSPAIASFTHALLGGWSPGLARLNMGCFCLFWTCFDGAAITALALFNGLVNDVIPRGFVGRFYALFRIVGLGTAIAFNTSLLALTDNYHVQVMLAIALGFGLALPLMCLMVKEGGYAQPQPDPAPGRRLALARAHLAECLAQPRYLWACAAFMLAAVTFNPFNTFSQNLALDLGITKAELGSLTAWSYLVSIATAFGVGWIADRFGAVRLSTVMMGLYVLIALAGYALVDDAASFRWFYPIHVVVSGAYFTAASSMPMDLFPGAEFVRYNSSKDIMVGFANVVVSTSQGPILDLSGHHYQLTLASAAVFALLCALCLARSNARPLAAGAVGATA
jgi:MFS family permease